MFSLLGYETWKNGMLEEYRRDGATVQPVSGDYSHGARTEPERHIQTLSITCVILSEALFAT